jgi:CBS domain-containing protein
MNTVFTIMSHGLRTVRPELSIESLVALFMLENLSRVLVVNEEGAPVGVVSKSDVIARQYLKVDTQELEEPRARLRRGVMMQLGWGFHLTRDEGTVAEIMTPQVVSIPEGASVALACEVMIRSRVNGLPVISASGPTGWISSMDIVQWVALSYDRDRKEEPAPAPQPGSLLV